MPLLFGGEKPQEGPGLPLPVSRGVGAQPAEAPLLLADRWLGTAGFINHVLVSFVVYFS